MFIIQHNIGKTTYCNAYPWLEKCSISPSLSWTLRRHKTLQNQTNHHQSSAIIFHHHPSSIKRKTQKEINKKKKKEEEEKTWLDLYVYYTTQYRKDNLLAYISSTRSVFHFSKFELNCLALRNTAKPNKPSSIIHHHFPSSSSIVHQKKNTKRNQQQEEEGGGGEDMVRLVCSLYNTI